MVNPTDMLIYTFTLRRRFPRSAIHVVVAHQLPFPASDGFRCQKIVDMRAWWEAAFQRSSSKRTHRSFLQYLPRASKMDWVASILSQMVDPRNDRATRLRYAERFFELLLGNMDPGFSLKLRQLVTHPTHLLGFFLYPHFLLWWAWAHRDSTSQTEFVHDRTRQ